jgi:DnaJ-class molecular chaperone
MATADNAFPRRELRRRKCGSCNGRGGIPNSETRQCDACSGVGWIELPKKAEEICSKCRGFQQIVVRHEDECEKCSGKGYSVVLVEVNRVKSERYEGCGKCAGLGRRLIKTRAEPKECTHCDGTGIDYDRAKASGLPMVNAPCRRCKGKLYVTRVRMRTATCKECKGAGRLLKPFWETVERIV